MRREGEVTIVDGAIKDCKIIRKAKLAKDPKIKEVYSKR